MQTAITYADAYHDCRRKLDDLIDWVNAGLPENKGKPDAGNTKPWWKFWDRGIVSP